MPGWVKALLITAIVVVMLIVGVAGAGYFWWIRNRDSLKANAKEVASEGRQFGQTSDNQACVDETFSRYKKAPGLFNSLNYAQFMRTCLEVSRPTPRFCDDVPVGKMFELMKWRDSQCSHYGVPNDRKCQQLLFAKMMFCADKQQAEKPGEG